MSVESKKPRQPSEPERRLLEALLSRCADCSPGWLFQLMVVPMTDGGMGSLRLLLQGGTRQRAVFGKRAAELQFEDADGVVVIASLNLDSRGLPFELDIWKTDYTPLLEIPTEFSEVPGQE